MTKLTEDQREDLDAQLSEVTQIIVLLETQIQPTRDAIRKLEQSRDVILEKFGIHESYEDLVKCETCGGYILEDDKRFSYEDGPDFCAEHAPTYTDRERETVEYIEMLRRDGVDGEDIEDAEGALAHIRSKIAEGHGDKRVVW